jgi:Transposase IS4
VSQFRIRIFFDFPPWRFWYAFLLTIHVALLFTMPDTRRVIGGRVWARADAVSNDAKRIYGSEASNVWLEGIVQEVMSQKRNASSKRATTYVKAMYRCGNMERVKILPLQVLKDKDPIPEIANENNEVPQAPPINDAENNVQQVAELAPPGAEVPPNIHPVSTNNGRNWYDGITDVDVNGPVIHRAWKMTCQYSGRVFMAGCDVQHHDVHNTLKPFDFFMACFPKEQIKFMVEQTTLRLRSDGHTGTSLGEILKWFGITILMTRFEFGSRASLWSEDSGSKYVPAPNLGTRTGMSRSRYDTIQKYLVWSYQPPFCPDGMSSENYRWLNVDGFVSRFNDHRKRYYQPSTVICVDESISRWYGMGGHWINMGLPMYVAMERKPEDGCEIQDACCGVSGIMMQLKVVRTAAGEAQRQQEHREQQEQEATGSVNDDNG